VTPREAVAWIVTIAVVVWLLSAVLA